MLKCNSSLQSHVLRGLFRKGKGRRRTVKKKVNVNSLVQNICYSEHHKQAKKTTDLEKLCSVHKTDKAEVSTIYRELLQIKTKETNNMVGKKDKCMEAVFSKVKR